METLNNHAYQEREVPASSIMTLKNNVEVPPHFENRIKVQGICSNCLNNSSCVWMENKKTACEEYN